jgi:hypothetical protein
VLRVALLLLVAILSFATTRRIDSLIWVCLLAVAALPSWTPPRHPVIAPIGRLAEVAITTIGASALAEQHGGAAASAVLPYLTVPIILPALSGRLRESMILLGIAGAALAAAGSASGRGKPSQSIGKGFPWISPYSIDPRARLKSCGPGRSCRSNECI